MNYHMRMRRWNEDKQQWETLFPQTKTENILRRDDGGVLERYLQMYDLHLRYPNPHLNHAKSYNGGRHLKADILTAPLCDGFPLLLELHDDLEFEPDLDYNNNGPANIINGNGERAVGGHAAGTVLFLVYRKLPNVWIMMNADSPVGKTRVVLPVISDYVYTATHDDERLIIIPDYDNTSDTLVVNYGQTILRHGVDYMRDGTAKNGFYLLTFGLQKGDKLYITITKYVTTVRKGSVSYDLMDYNYKVEADEDETTLFEIPGPALGAHSLTVNYGQTILRNGLDFDFTEDKKHIQLKNFSLQKGEYIVYTATRFEEFSGDAAASNWGTAGNYRYSFKVFHEEFTATRKKTTVIPVPHYNRKRDEITVIRENHMLIYDVDYTIDELNQIVLLTSELDIGDTIYFTILCGAMLDVPNFNVINATGHSAQHLLVDMTYNQLCNFYTLLVKLKFNLVANPTLKCIDGPAEPICDPYGNYVSGGYKAGSYLWLVYNEDQHRWYSMSHGKLDVSRTVPTNLNAHGEANFFGGLINPEIPEMGFGETVVKHGMGFKPMHVEVRPMDPPVKDENGEYITVGDIWTRTDEQYLYVGNSGNSRGRFAWDVSTTTQSNNYMDWLEDLQQELVELRAAPGYFYTELFVFEAPENGVTDIQVEKFVNGRDKLIVNYGQTVLRQNLDYDLIDHGIHLKDIALQKGDIIQFMIIFQNTSKVEDWTPEHWGTNQGPTWTLPDGFSVGNGLKVRNDGQLEINTGYGVMIDDEEKLAADTEVMVHEPDIVTPDVHQMFEDAKREQEEAEKKQSPGK